VAERSAHCHGQLLYCLSTGADITAIEVPGPCVAVMHEQVSSPVSPTDDAAASDVTAASTQMGPGVMHHLHPGLSWQKFLP